MSERWQRELTKLRRAELPDGLWERAVEGPRLEPPGEPGMPRAAAGILALAVFVGGAVLAWIAFSPFGQKVEPLGGNESGTYEVPPVGEVAPVFLPDGRPVFIVRHDEDSLSVIDSFSTHTPWGITDLIGWCPSTRQFVELAHEARFTEYGRYDGAGPAPTGVATYGFEVVDQDASGLPASIRIGEPRDPIGEGSGDPCCERPPLCPPGGNVGSMELVTVTGGASGSVGDVVAHRVDAATIWESPAAAAEANPEGWIAVRGTLWVNGKDGFVQMCRDLIGERPENYGERSVEDDRRCEDGAIVRGVTGVEMLFNLLGPYPGTAYEEEQVWLARVQDGILSNLAGIMER